MSLAALHIALVGPVAPPEGGMAGQTRQLAELLRGEGARVTLVPVNAPYRPRWIGRLRGVRALFRLVPYVVRLWRVAGEADVLHIMANSGWSWHLFAAPAVAVARVRGVPCVVNYRGGEAERFLRRSAATVLPVLRRADALTVPSAFLRQIFGRHGVSADIVPNIIDLQRFRPAAGEPDRRAPRLVVARNLEALYDIGTALRAFARIRAAIPAAKLTVAGSGPERDMLVRLAEELGVASAVDFCGRLERDAMADLYRAACLVLNPSRVDNMPNSVLEAMASGVPVVSTDAGGVPFILRHGLTGLLVPPGDDAAMATAALRLLDDAAEWQRIREAALADVQQYTWGQVRERWSRTYAAVISGVRGEVHAA
jgi:glycosyltransferase involved in cell wall biosynthesis